MIRKFAFASLLSAVCLSFYSLAQTEPTSTQDTPSPLAVYLYPQDQKVKTGDQAAWYITAAGAEPIRYQWKLNGKAVPGAQGNTLKIASAKAGDQGTYTCSLSNKFGAVETEPVQLSLVSQGTLSTVQKINTNKASSDKTAQNTIK